MHKGTIVKYASIVVAVVVGITLISNHPVPILLLGACAAGYFIGQALEKGKIK